MKTNLIKAMPAAILLALAGGTQANLSNGTFADYDANPEGVVNYPSGDGAPGWYVQADSLNGTDIVTDESLDSPADPSVMRGGELGEGFGDNKNEQCIPIDGNRRLSIDYLAYSPESDTDGLAIRVNPNFYANMEECISDLRGDASDFRLSGDDDNEDLDVDVIDAVNNGEWTRVSQDENGQAMSFGPDGSGASFVYPDGANVMYLSVRMRDRSESGGLELYLDDIRVFQEGSAANLVLNGDFSHRAFAGDDLVAGDDGWLVDRFGDFGAAVGPAWFALEDNNVYYSQGQGGGYGDAKLDQCYSLADIERLAPEVFALTATPDAELSGRIAVDLHDAPDCGGDKLAEFESDFDALNAPDGNIEAGVWYSMLAAGENDGDDQIDVDLATDYPDAQSGFISVRLRDRSLDGDDPNPDLPRTVFIDDVNLSAAVSTPVPNPLPGAVSLDSDDQEVTLALTSATDDTVIYYTTDGSDPDPDSSDSVNNGEDITMTTDQVLRAVAVGPSMTRSAIRTVRFDGESNNGGGGGGGGGPGFGDGDGGGGSSPSSGCTLSAVPGKPDPTLPGLAALALLVLWLRRRAA